MIPILYTHEEKNFNTNGLGHIPCVSCVVRKERNAFPECEFEVSNTEPIFPSIQLGCIIYVIHDQTKLPQPFDIYARSEPINGVVKFSARHIAARLDKIPVNPYTATSCAQALARLKSNSIIENPFTFTTTKDTNVDFAVTKPMSAKDILGGVNGSILDVFGGGEYEFDHFTVTLKQHIGTDTGVEIRYGKNIVNYQRDFDDSAVYDAVIPYWVDPMDSSNVVMLPERIVRGDFVNSRLAPWTNEDDYFITNESGVNIEFEYVETNAVPLDCTQYFESQPTESDLRNKAISLINNSKPWLPTENIDIDFINLADMVGYEDVAPLERVKLCDTVNVIYPELGVIAENVQIVKTEYDALMERYRSMELGEVRSTLNNVVRNTVQDEVKQSMEKVPAIVDSYVEAATQLLTGADGGHLLIALDQYGKPQELFIMDTEDQNTATNIWRYNVNGWGFSSNGIEGPYTIAATMNGAIVADLVRTGMLKGPNDQNYWNLDTGYISFLAGKMADFTIENGTLKYINGSYNTQLSGGYGLLCGEDGVGYTSVERNFISFYGPNLHNEATPAYITYSRTNKRLYMQSLDPGTSYVLGSVSLESDTKFKGYNTAELGTTYGSYYVKVLQNKIMLYGNTEVTGSLSVSGTKPRLVTTKDYAQRYLYCYETPSPMFGDIGEGIVGEDGKCYIWIDPIFAETVSLKKYQVFLQAYGAGSLRVAERTGSYFLVEGDAGTAFSWELKAKQADYENLRLERKIEQDASPFVDYGAMAKNHIENINKERGLSA